MISFLRVPYFTFFRIQAFEILNGDVTEYFPKNYVSYKLFQVLTLLEFTERGNFMYTHYEVCISVFSKIFCNLFEGQVGAKLGFLVIIFLIKHLGKKNVKAKVVERKKINIFTS